MNIRRSIRRLSILFIILFVAVSGGLVYWQVVVAQQVASNTHQNLGRQCLADSIPKRGNIFDRNGVLLAYSELIPSNTKNPNQDQICTYQRVYTHQSMTAVIGYYVSPIFCAKFPLHCEVGIEKQFDHYLNGRIGGVTGLNNTINQLLHVPPVGDDIYLTIDVRIQDYIYNHFNEEAPSTGHDDVFPTNRGSVIVTDPHTGEILAMVSSPGYDANRLASGDAAYLNQLVFDPTRPLDNRAIDDCYVPGSTYKTMTLMAALDSGKFTLDSPFYDDHDPTHLQARGPVTLGTNGQTETFFPIEDNIEGYTYTFPVSLIYGYTHSDNVIFAQVATNTGANTWLDYNHAFYVDKQIPFDLPVKVSTVTPQQDLCTGTPQQENPLIVARLAENGFGQGVDFVTPLQMSLFDDAAANNGQLMRPTLIEKIVDPSQSVLRSFSPTVLGNPISQQTATEVRDAMYGVVSCGSGSLTRVQLSYPFSTWSVIGKTGTGQVPTPNTPAESWFITAAPYVYQSGGLPAITITAMKENGGEGAYANGPMLRDIYQYIFTKVLTNVQQPSPPDSNFCFSTGLLQPHP